MNYSQPSRTEMYKSDTSKNKPEKPLSTARSAAQKPQTIVPEEVLK